MNANPVAVPVQIESGASGWEAIPLGARIGRVVALDEDAAPLVDFPGNAVPPIRANDQSPNSLDKSFFSNHRASDVRGRGASESRHFGGASP